MYRDIWTLSTAFGEEHYRIEAVRGDQALSNEEKKISTKAARLSIQKQ